MQSHKLIKYKGNGYNPGQSKAELLTWSSITIGKILPPPHHIYVPQLFRAIQYYCQLCCTTTYDVVRRRTNPYDAIRGH